MRDRLLAIIKALGLHTQAEIARRLDVSQGTVSKWLKGEQQPTGTKRDLINQLHDQLFGKRTVDEPLRDVYVKLLKLPPDQQQVILAMLNAAIDAALDSQQRKSKKR